MLSARLVVYKVCKPSEVEYNDPIAIGAFRAIRKRILTSVYDGNKVCSCNVMIDNVTPWMLVSTASSINRPLLNNKTKFISLLY
ncbi:hypothetical protein BHM03_00022558 [Ensete ventricosum]|nr:hypothetical protein BHM03_00022558 [Ensete ventricosum]